MVLPPSSTRRSELDQQCILGHGTESLTRLDLSSSRLTTASEGLAVILDTDASRQEDSAGHTGTGRRTVFVCVVLCVYVCVGVDEIYF